MKKIYFVRHAKSSWEFPELSDRNRPLNQRGMRDAPRMAKFISEKIPTPDAFISSPAVRAIYTANFFANTFNDAEIEINEGLYHASESKWCSFLKNLENRLNTVMVFGHNPAITDVVNEVSGSNIMNIPTCGIAAVKFNVDSWDKVLDIEGELEFYHFPKGI